ncbi:InlB B-repeat-containing protein [Lysinibacillus boronitolerans]|uniref:InlB B-repeat-containing protein n=1 Tax=Lysinibacillus boronitolerans TaxID=309788 RepID=UPI00289D7ED4|nr:InlB B-repeat-containing protein [Lysinibacillus boronitolerans]
MNVFYQINEFTKKIVVIWLVISLSLYNWVFVSVEASTDNSDILYPTEELNVQFINGVATNKWDLSNGETFSLGGAGASLNYKHAMRFNIPTNITIESASLVIYEISQCASPYQLKVRVNSGTNDWNSGYSDNKFPMAIDNSQAVVQDIVQCDASENYYPTKINVKSLLNSTGAIGTNGQVTLILETDTSISMEFPHAKTTLPEYRPRLEIEYGSAQKEILLNSTSVAENQPPGTTVGALSTTSPDAGGTYSLVNGLGDNNNSSFTIVGNELRTNSSFDYERKNSYSVRIKFTDSANNFYEKEFTITVTDINESPTDILLSSLSIEENQPTGTTVGTLSTTDPDVGETFTYSLVNGLGDNDNNSFSIDGTQLKTAGVFDYEAKSSFSVRIRVTDKGGQGLTFDKSFTIDVTKINKAPTDILLSATSVVKNQPSGTKVGTLSATDPDAGSSFTYSLVNGAGSTDNSSFSIVGNELRTNSSFDYQTKNSYSVRIQVTDNKGLTFEKIFTISVTELNEGPTDITLSSLTVAENEPVGTVVGTFSTTDPNVGDTFTYSLVAGTGATENSSFTIDGNQLKTAEIFDYETKNNYSVRIQVSDSTNNLYEKAFTISISDVNEAPTDISLSPTSIAENQPPGTKVGTLSTTDADVGETFTYSLVVGTGDTDNSSFTIVGDELRTNSPFDYETKNSYSVRIKVTDKGGLFYDKEFTISVTDVNEDPVPTLISTAPANNATNIPINPTLTLTFSENVSGVAGKNIRIYGPNNSLIDTIDATNATVNGSTVSIHPTNTLLKGTTYYVLMDNGAFVDTANQGVAGITDENIWRFATLPPSNNANLSDLVISSGNLNPNFTDSTVNYQVNVAHNIENIDITPTTANSNATLKVNSASVASGVLNTIPLNVGSNTFNIVVTAENGVATKTYTLTVIRALPTLEQVADVTLSTSGIATWTDIAGESSYAVQLFKEGSPIGNVVDILADTTTHNFLSTMRAAGEGAYTVTVTAKGDGLIYLDGAPSISSNTQTIIKLASITNGLSWDGNIAKWQAIPNAVSYDVLLYKEGIAVGTATNVLVGNINEGVDFTAAFQTNGIGSYTFTVQSKGNELLILDGDQGISSTAKIISPLTYTVLYDGNGSTGGTVPQDSTMYNQNDDVTVVANDGNLVKTGYSFIGWNTKADGTGTSYLPNATFKIATENITLFARWEINQYTVSFDVDGGSAVSNQTVAHGEKASQPTPAPTKAGHTFDGWYTSDAYTTLYDFDSAITANTTIYAKWEPVAVTHTVSFDVAGGSAVSNQTVAHGEKASQPTPVPTKAGHTFDGWYTSDAYTTPYDFESVITADTTIYAKWTPVTVTYTVSFNVDGGSAVSNQTVAHGEKASQPTPVPTKAGHTFGGWYTSNAYTTPYNFDNAITANTMIYAKWISSNSNTGGGNTNSSSNPESGSTTPSANVEEIEVDVESGDGDLVSKTAIKRTKNVDNTINDEVTLTAQSATETIRKLKEQGNDKARIIIPDQQDQVNQVHVSVPRNVVTLLQNSAVHLEIVTDNVRIEVPKTSLETFNDNLYFRLVPIKERANQLDIKEQAKKERAVQQLAGSTVVELLGRPMTIETNMQSRPVILTLPLPTDLTREQLNHLAIYIEHSDGTKEVVRGKVVEYQKGITGLQFEVNKFSTFSILYLPEKEEVKEPTTDGVTHLPYIQGYPDGTFRPNAPVTRAQMASMFARQLTGNAIPQAKATYTDTFQHDAKDAIEFAKEKGLFKGVTATNFNPNGLITRAQMATVAARWIEQQCVERPDADFCQPTSPSAAFKDVSFDHWAVKAIDTVNAAEIMTGVTADTFNPDGFLTRAQAVKVLNRLFERQVLTEVQTPLFTDVLRQHWAFYEIQEAAKK